MMVIGLRGSDCRPSLKCGFVLLIPIAFTVVQRTRTSLIMVGLPMVAGLSVVHGLVPPHPLHYLRVTIYKADVGRTILYALLVGLPTAVIAGPLYAKLIAPHIKLPERKPHGCAVCGSWNGNAACLALWLTLFTILISVVIDVSGVWADGVSAPKSALTRDCI